MTRSLADIQRNFATMLRADLSPGGRAGIYHNNRRGNFCKALALTYPVTARIVGEDFFTRQALDYLALHPSRHGDLHHAGRRFPQFLASGFASQDSEFAYLADLARLEWAWAEALVCADASIVGSESLTAFEPSTWPLLRFSLHPSVTLISSTWPIHTIFDEHRRDQPALVSLSAGGECVAVLRRAQIVEAHRLNAGEYRGGLRCSPDGRSVRPWKSLSTNPHLRLRPGPMPLNSCYAMPWHACLLSAQSQR